MKKQIDGNTACSNIAYLFSEICSIYPITPSSTMASNIDFLTHTDLKNLFNSKPKVIEMQSEAGAAGAWCFIIRIISFHIYSKSRLTFNDS